MRGKFGKGTAIMAALLASTSMALAEDVEVLHWWTSGGEAAALNVLKGDRAGQSIGWVDMPVAGGGGEAAMTTLRAAPLDASPRPSRNPSKRRRRASPGIFPSSW